MPNGDLLVAEQNGNLRTYGCEPWGLHQVTGLFDVSAGYTEAHPLGNISEIGVVEGRPFTLERETLAFVNLGKSAFVLYWSDGRYWRFSTAD